MSHLTIFRSRSARSPICELLEERYGDKLDERGVEYIGFAVDGAKRMQVLINDLLTFSRVGRLDAANSEVDLGAALDEAIKNLATAIEDPASRSSTAATATPDHRRPHAADDVLAEPHR